MFGSLSADDEDIRKRLIDTEPLVDTVVGALQDNDEGNPGVLIYLQWKGSGSVGSVKFWLHSSVSAKIFGSKGQNINQKLHKKICSQPKSEM